MGETEKIKLGQVDLSPAKERWGKGYLRYIDRDGNCMAVKMKRKSISPEERARRVKVAKLRTEAFELRKEGKYDESIKKYKEAGLEKQVESTNKTKQRKESLKELKVEMKKRKAERLKAKIQKAKEMEEKIEAEAKALGLDAEKL